MKRFVPRYLDPASRLGEILFGLIMTLTVTLSAGLAADEGRAGVRQLLAAAIGCNLAWGIIDAVMYVMNCITVRSGKRRLIDAVQHAPDENAALAIIENEVEPELQSMLEPDRADAFRRSILRHIPREPLASLLSLKKISMARSPASGSSFFRACLPHCHFSSSPIRIWRCGSRIFY